MREYTFLYKENDTDDRDCVKYIDIGRLGKLECGHYFPHIGTTGACFSMGLYIDKIDFDNITTILTKEDFEALDRYNKQIDELKYGIEEGDNRHRLGLHFFEEIKPILEKLKSEENEELFLKVQEEEKEYLMDEYHLDEDDIEKILNNYYLSYRDRGIVGCVYDDAEECGQEYIDSCMNIDSWLEPFIDYKKFGEHLIYNGEGYLELDDGRVVRLNY